jgi:DNA-binding IclR family transcriptional regulator
MVITYEELKGKTVAELRDLAKDLTHDAVLGYTQMHKEQLIRALCRALGIESHERHQVVGIDKSAIKAEMRALKKERDAAIDAHDREHLAIVRHKLHHLNHQLRSHMA